MEMLLAIGATAAVGVTSHRVTSRPCRATPACRSTSWWYSALALIRAVGSDARRALRDTYAGHSRAPIGGKPDPWSAEGGRPLSAGSADDARRHKSNKILPSCLPIDPTPLVMME